MTLWKLTNPTLLGYKIYDTKTDFRLISVMENISSIYPGLTQELVGFEPAEKVIQCLSFCRAGEDRG